MSYFKVNEKCNGCLACLQNCPANAIDVRDEDNSRTLYHNMARCARCGNCWRVCPQQAIEFQYIMENEWDEVTNLDLMFCEVCGEVVYTSAFSDKLTEKLGDDKPPLCDKHKEGLALKVRAHFIGQPLNQNQKR